MIKRRKGSFQSRDHEYRKFSRYFAQMPEDVKDIAVAELMELGASDIRTVYRGAHFSADAAALYRINYGSRLLSRVLAPLLSFDCPDADALYKAAKTIRWRDFFPGDETFAVFANVSDSSAITHSRFAALRLKDAIVDDLREKTGERPNVNTRDPDVVFNLHIQGQRAVISLDTSGEPLYKRGYRVAAGDAPMQETVAAAILRLMEWDGEIPLYDPMCGSGTLLCEALMRCCRIPAGIIRGRFGFERLPDFDAALWQKVKAAANANIRPLPTGRISGSDIKTSSVEAARTNLMGLHSGREVMVRQAAIADLDPLPPGVVAVNPPYGLRMGKDQDLALLYQGLGDFLKQKCKGCAAYIYFGERALIKKLGLKPAWKRPLSAGGLDGRLVKYELY